MTLKKRNFGFYCDNSLIKTNNSVNKSNSFYSSKINRVSNDISNNINQKVA